VAASSLTRLAEENQARRIRFSQSIGPVFFMGFFWNRNSREVCLGMKYPDNRDFPIRPPKGRRRRLPIADRRHSVAMDEQFQTNNCGSDEFPRRPSWRRRSPITLPRFLRRYIKVANKMFPGASFDYVRTDEYRRSGKTKGFVRRGISYVRGIIQIAKSTSSRDLRRRWYDSLANHNRNTLLYALRLSIA